MKDQDTILTFQETEELCRRYIDCQLSVLEEKELQYVLGYLQYDSPVIQEARESMMAEGLLSKLQSNKHIPTKTHRFKWKRLTAGIAASVVITVVSITFVLKNHKSNDLLSDNHITPELSTKDYILAYQNGKRLSHEEAIKAADESEKLINDFFAYAEAKKKESEEIQNFIINSMSNNK